MSEIYIFKDGSFTNAVKSEFDISSPQVSNNNDVYDLQQYFLSQYGLLARNTSNGRSLRVYDSNICKTYNESDNASFTYYIPLNRLPYPKKLIVEYKVTNSSSASSSYLWLGLRKVDNDNNIPGINTKYSYPFPTSYSEVEIDVSELDYADYLQIGMVGRGNNIIKSIKVIYTTYNWQPISSIVGNNKTYILAKIKNTSINDGEPVTGASSSDFDVLTNSNLVSKMINGVLPSDNKVIVTYSIPEGTYEYIKLVYKKGSIPTSYSDGTAIDITQSSTEQKVSGIADGGTYWFVIFTDKSTSEPKKIKTVEAPTPQEVVLYDATGSTLYIDERINADSKWDIYSEYSYDYGKIRLRDGYIGQSGRNNVNNRSTTQAKFNISGYKYLCVTGENTDNLGPTNGRCFVVFSQNKPTDYSELYTLPHTENQYSPINTISTKKVDISNLGFTEGYITIFGAITRYKVYKLWFEKEVT